MKKQSFPFITFLFIFLVSFIQIEKRTKSIHEIISFIDKVYEIKSITKTDSLSDFTKIKSDTLLGMYNNSYGLVNYAKGDIKKYYKHISFEFYIFKNKLSASTNFKELIRLSNLNESYNTSDGKKHLNLFSKAGCTYILYDNIIIHHLRRCNYNEKIETPRETKLLSYLFNDKLPAKNYFIRVKCGWANAEIN